MRETLSGPSGTFEFLLDGKLKVTRSEPKVAEVPLGDGFHGFIEAPGYWLDAQHDRVRVDGWTATRRILFLELLEEHGSILAAARVCGMSRRAVTKRERMLCGESE